MHDEPLGPPVVEDTRAPKHVRMCPFADRCPHVMQICRTSPPPLYRLDEDRVAACFLYREGRAALATEHLNEVITLTHG